MLLINIFTPKDFDCYAFLLRFATDKKNYIVRVLRGMIQK